jgi:Rieske 2Fe-2S family protein
VSEDIYAKERERVFPRQWTFLGHVSEIPEAGDFFRQDLLGESVIVVRQADGSIKGHLNICRHRGHAVCTAEKGRAKVFTCPYHQWAYNLDGTLRRAPGFPDGDSMSYAVHGLHPVPIGNWHGFLFGWLDKTAAKPFDQCLPLEPKIAKLAPERMKEIKREPYAVAANWKVMLENYLECYHCNGMHPELCVTMDVEATYKNTATDWKGEYFSGEVQLRPGMMTASMTGALLSKPLGDFAGARSLPAGYGGGVGVLPTLSRIILHIDHAIVHFLRPVDVGNVRWETRWYVSADAVEGVDYEVEKVAEVWRLTNLEDISLCESSYRGVCSRHYVPGPLHPQREGAIRPALDTYLDLMGRA